VAQSYKLRLSDGTVLVVDYAGLNTWLVDGQAMVQSGSSQQWHPLKEFLAKERAAARRATRRKADASPPRDPLERELPLVPPPPKKEATPSPFRDPLKRDLPLVPPPPKKGATPPPPRKDHAPAELPPLFASEPVELSIGAPADVQVLAEEPSKASAVTAPASVPEPPARTSTRVEETFVSLPPRPLGEEQGPLRPVLLPRPEPVVAPSSIDEPTAVQVLADELAASPSEPVSSPGADFLPVIRLKPSDSVPPMRRTPRPRQDLHPPASEEAASAPTPPWRALDPVPPPAAVAPVPSEEPPAIRLKPIDDEPSPRPSPPSWRDAGLDEEKPRRPVARHWVEEPGRAELAVTSLLRSPLGGKAWRVTDRLGALLSRGLAPVNRLERGLPPFSPDDESPSWAPLPAASAPPSAFPGGPTTPPDESLPALPRKPIDDGETAPAFDRARARASAWVASTATWVGGFAGQVGGVPARLQGLLHRARPPAPIRDLETEVESVARDEPTPPPDRARGPLRASAGLPPSPPPESPFRIEQLPVLRFKEIPEPEEVEDVYEGDDAPYGGSVAQAAWQWTQRLVLTAVLVGGAILAALTWRTWFPRAAQLGQTTFTEIDRHARFREVASRQAKAVEEASRALPQLAPETIRLVMAGSPTGVLDAPDVLHIASDAADRGASALAPEEADELRTLQRRLVDVLPSEERESVLTYERARATRAVFPFEDREVVPLLAHGVRTLPPETQERLQALLGKAVAAGLAQGKDEAPGGAPEP
jgi:hypothetical protein